MRLFNGNIEEDILISLFQKERVSTSDLIKIVNKRKDKVSKQGIYRVLRKLKGEEKVVIYKSLVSINELWLIKLRTVLGEKDKNLSLIGDLSSLKEKEKISLNIKTLIHLDQVWSNIFLSIEPKIKNNVPLYLFNPHNWFLLLREETEKIHMERLSKQRRQTFLTVSGSYSSDREMVRMVRTKDFHCSINSKVRSKDYLAILENFLITIKLDNRTNVLMDKIFQNDSLEDIKTLLYDIAKKATARIVIERNKNKANQWGKRLSKDF